MSIKKKLKKEKNVKRNTLIFTFLLMLFMTYIVMTLYESGFFEGYEKILFLTYLAIVDTLLFAIILRTIADNKFSFVITNNKIKIIDGLFESAFSIPEEWIVFIDACEKQYNKDDIEVLIVMSKGKRNSKLLNFDEVFFKRNRGHRETYLKLKEEYGNEKLYYYIIKRSGSKKYYYLYYIYKNFYNVKFSKRALDYIREFMEEYKL